MTNTVDDIIENASFDKTFITGYPFPYFVDEIRLSHSTLQTLESCPRKFEFSKLYQNAKHEDSLASAFGTALHIGFQEYLTSGDYNRAVYRMMLAYPWEYGESAMKDRSAEGALALLDEMIKQFPSERYELAFIADSEGNPIPCTEVPFRIRFREWPHIDQTALADAGLRKPIAITYVGYMDLVLHDKLEDKYIVVDIKTTSDRLEDMSPKYKFSDQTVPYGLVLNKLLGISEDELEVGYYVAKPNITNPVVQFYKFYKSSEDLSDWASGMAMTLRQLESYVGCQFFPRTRSGCSFFGRTCPYFDYCHDRDSKRTQLQLAFAGEMEPPLPFEPLVEVEISLQELEAHF